MMLKRASLFAVLLCAGIAAAGCASSPKSPAEPADESAQFAPVNYLDICLLENNEVKSPKLVDAIESGFRKAGANVKRLRAGSGPDACSFVVTYEVPNKQGSVNVIRYQTYEHGIPRVDATGFSPTGPCAHGAGCGGLFGRALIEARTQKSGRRRRPVRSAV